jgi:methionyl-tRNA formyltransferase
MNDSRICLLTKESLYSNVAINFIKQNFSDYRIVKSDSGELLNGLQYEMKFDYIIAFLYPNIVPESVLKNAKTASVNFHPGPPEYPGAGCYSFALYNEETFFGTTCHHMLKRPDTGHLIFVKRFPIFETDTLSTLKERTMTYTLLNFFEMMYLILEKKELPVADEHWKRDPYLQKDFRKLLEINSNMSTNEIDKRIRATAHPLYPGPYFEIQGKKYTIRC